METLTQENTITGLIKSSGLNESTEIAITNSFAPFVEKMQEWKERASELVVTHESQKSEMKMAQTARKALKEIRVSADKIRKELKADSLAYGKAVQEVYNYIEDNIKPIEEHLLLQEKFIEIKEERERKAVLEFRMSEIDDYKDFLPIGTDLEFITDAEFEQVFNNAKKLHDLAVEEAKVIEATRIEKERIEKIRESRERELARYADCLDRTVDYELGTISAVEYDKLLASCKKAKAEKEEAVRKQQEENERLKKEAEENTKKLEAERKANEAKLAKLEAERKAEAQKQAKIEAEKLAKLKAERKANEEKLEQEKAERERLEAKLKEHENIEKIESSVHDLSFEEVFKHLERLQSDGDVNEKVLNSQLDRLLNLVFDNHTDLCPDVLIEHLKEMKELDSVVEHLDESYLVVRVYTADNRHKIEEFIMSEVYPLYSDQQYKMIN